MDSPQSVTIHLSFTRFDSVKKKFLERFETSFFVNKEYECFHTYVYLAKLNMT